MSKTVKKIPSKSAGLAIHIVIWFDPMLYAKIVDLLANSAILPLFWLCLVNYIN